MQPLIGLGRHYPWSGLLAEDFTQPYIRHFDLSNGFSAELRRDVHIPLQPFCGTMGVALDEEGAMDVLPSSKAGGNIDTRHLNVGTKLRLPVYVPAHCFRQVIVTRRKVTVRCV